MVDDSLHIYKISLHWAYKRISSSFWLFYFIHSWLISGSWSRSILLPWQNKRNPVWVLRPRPQSTTNHATSSFESNCFCQLNPICQHDFGSIFWQSPGGIQLFQELVKNHFIIPFRPFVCCWDQKAAQAKVDLACAQQKKTSQLQLYVPQKWALHAYFGKATLMSKKTSRDWNRHRLFTHQK